MLKKRSKSDATIAIEQSFSSSVWVGSLGGRREAKSKTHKNRSEHDKNQSTSVVKQRV